jgi:cytochrome c-type biogenesis protein CcmH
MGAAPGSANASPARGVQDRAQAATAAGNHAEATRLYEQLTRMTPSSAGAWYSLGLSRMRQRNGRGAAAALERATQLSPRNANYWAALGTARRNAGDAGGSRAAFQQALRVDPNNATARRGLGQ